MRTNGQNFWVYIIHRNAIRQTKIIGREYDGEWMRLDKKGKLTIKASRQKGYAWDGCTPKGAFLDQVWGIPDGVIDPATEKPKTYYASLFHDVLYQFGKEAGVRRKEADDLFLEIMTESHFLWRYVYYGVVRLVSWGLY